MWLFFCIFDENVDDMYNEPVWVSSVTKDGVVPNYDDKKCLEQRIGPDKIDYVSIIRNTNGDVLRIGVVFK